MDYKVKIIVLFILLSLFNSELIAQCCSQGTPLDGSANTGVLEKGNLKFRSFYRYSFADAYYTINKPADFSFVQKSEYHYWGNTFAYGVAKKLTAEAEMGYFFQKKQIIDDTPPLEIVGSGFNNFVLSFKYSAIKDISRNIELTVGGGVKIPFQTTPRMSNNVTLPSELQPSTLAFGNVFHFFIHKKFKNEINFNIVSRSEINYENNLSYRYGNSYINSLFISKQLIKPVSLILQLKHEYKDMNFSFDKKLINTGGQIGFISPQVVYSPNEKWMFASLVDIPVFRRYNGTQLGNKYSLSFSIGRNFCF